MKRILFVCYLLQYCCILAIGQEDEKINHWTIGTAYLPRLEKYDYHIHYPLSLGLAIEYRINGHFSISLGTNLHYEKIKIDPLENIKINPQNFWMIYWNETTTLYEIPVQLKYYYTKDKTKTFLPFFKTALIGTHNRMNRSILYNSGLLDISNFDEYYLLWQLGYGVDIKIYKRISMTAQIAFGFDLINIYYDDQGQKFRTVDLRYSHIEPLVGLRYGFK